MCGRFVVGDPDQEIWADWLQTDRPAPWPEPNWNLAPTQTAAIVTADDGARRQRLARWGLVPRWWRKPLAELKAATFNARSEEAHRKPMFRDAWARARCLVPALGYYEWTGKPGAKRAHYVTLKSNAPGIVFAGLWAQAWPEGRHGDAALTSFTILTCAAGSATAHLHPRSPVILAEADWGDWLAGTAGPELMRPPPDELVASWEVDARVGRVRENGAALIEPVGLGL
ncbi:MAG: SOS response-associated peptidase [Pikeienuella sp.]